MPWKTMSTLDLRREFVQQAEAGAISFAQLCARYEISRKTGYKWLGRYRSGREDGLKDRSRRPRVQPLHLSPQAEESILALRRPAPGVGRTQAQEAA